MTKSQYGLLWDISLHIATVLQTVECRLPPSLIVLLLPQFLSHQIQENTIRLLSDGQTVNTILTVTTTTTRLHTSFQSTDCCIV